MGPLPVFTLVGDYEFKVVKACLGSFERYCRDHVELVLMNDGTLKPEQAEALRELLPKAVMVGKGEMRERMAGQLKGRPRCAAFLEELIYAWKLLAPAAMAEAYGGDLVQMDSDVIYYRPFCGLDRRGEAGEDYVYMPERRDSYSVGLRTRYLGADRIRLPQGANAGLLFMRKGMFDWDFVEWFLGRGAYRKYAGVVEQTAWAALGARGRCYRFVESQINIPDWGEDVSPALVGQHLLAGRKRLAEHSEYLALVEAVVKKGEGGVVWLKTERVRVPTLVKCLAVKGMKVFRKKSEVEGMANPAEVMVAKVRSRWAGGERVGAVGV